MSGMPTQLGMNQIAELVNVPASAGTSAIISAFSEQFVARADLLGDDEVALFDAVFMEILRQSGIDDRVLLAERLAGVPNAPLKLVMTLAQDDEIRVCGPVLRQSSRIAHATLLEIAATKGEAYQSSIAMRASLPQDICGVLARCSTPVVLIILVNNPGARFDGDTRKTIVLKAFGHAGLFFALDGRSEFAKVIMAAHEQGWAVLPLRDADAEVAGFVAEGQVDFALSVIAIEAKTRHRVAASAYRKDALTSFVVVARAANLSWGTMVGLLLNQFGISISAHQINESRRLFEDMTRREALHKTRIMDMAEMRLSA
jgi:Uncharacterised protein conserved in bacteria (DUF2336)